MEYNTTEIVIPESPKVTPNEVLFVHVPIATYGKPGVAVFRKEYFRVLSDGTVIPNGGGIGRPGSNETGEIFNDYDNNVASGNYTHAGGKGTKATEEAQMAVGMYNTEDSEALFIVGNGIGMSDEQRSNAFVVGKDGNAYVGSDRKRLATVDEVGSTTSSGTDWLTYYNYRIQEMTADYSQADYYGEQGSAKKVAFLEQFGTVEGGDFEFVRAMYSDATRVVYHPFRTGRIFNIDIAAVKWVLVPRGITSVAIKEYGGGVLDLTAFGPDTPFPQLEEGVSSMCEVMIPRDRADEFMSMTNWCDATPIEVDVSGWFN